jgi:hypothetical protein
MNDGKGAIRNEYCRQCSALCCHNLSIEIGKPENKNEVAQLKWQLHFDTVKVYIHNRRWYQLIKGRCMYLSPQGLCTIYQKRPAVCRRHNPPHCEFFGDYYDFLISTPRELNDYLDSKRRRKIKRKLRGKRS